MIVVGLAFVVIVRRGDKPLQGWRMIATGFILGYALFSVLLAGLDLIFPPLP